MTRNEETAFVKYAKYTFLKRAKETNHGKTVMTEKGFGMIQANLEKVLELLERDKRIYEIVKGCPYEILKALKLKKYSAGEFILEQGEVHDTFI